MQSTTVDSGSPAKTTQVFALWMLAGLAILLFGVLGSTVSYWSREALGRHIRSWPTQLTLEVLFWLAYVPLVFPATKLARRFRLDPSSMRPLTVLVHVIAGF